MTQKCGKSLTEHRLKKIKSAEKQLEMRLNEDQSSHEEALFIDDNFSKFCKYLKLFKKLSPYLVNFFRQENGDVWRG